MAIRIRLLGGPADGEVFPLLADTPPLRYLVPLRPSLSALLSGDCIPAEHEEYEPVRRDHHLDLADDGAYLYRHRAKPLTTEQRQELEAGRLKLRAEEERRDRELDETWAKIREERPGYPEDWRDIL